jgi:hypothetical protein
VKIVEGKNGLFEMLYKLDWITRTRLELDQQENFQVFVWQERKRIALLGFETQPIAHELILSQVNPKPN